jgi:YegS/Rv2252/BmrU family lipid kinase
MQRPRPLFVINPVAGGGRAKRVMDRAAGAIPGPAEIVVSTAPGDAEELALRGAREGFSPVVAVGGDGTAQEVANGLLHCPEPPPMSIVPAGGGNDLARTLRLPKDPMAAIRLAWSDVAGAIDVGACNGRHFLNVAGVGLDTKVAMAVNARPDGSRGRLTYVAEALAELRRYENPELTLRLDDEVIVTKSLLVAIGNGRYFAGGMKVCPGADPADGWFDVTIGGDLGRLETLALLPTIFVGQHGRHGKVAFHRVRRVCIEGPAEMAVQLDGEIAGALPAEIGVRPGALRIVGWRGGNRRFVEKARP